MDNTERQRLIDAGKFIDSIRESILAEIRREEYVARSNVNHERHRLAHFSLLVTEALLAQATSNLRELNEWSRLKNGSETRDTDLERMQRAVLEQSVTGAFSVSRRAATRAIKAIMKDGEITNALLRSVTSSAIGGADAGGEPVLFNVFAPQLENVTNPSEREVIFYAAACSAAERERRKPTSSLRPTWLSGEMLDQMQRTTLFVVEPSAHSIRAALSNRNEPVPYAVFMADVRDTGCSVVVYSARGVSFSAMHVIADIENYFGLPPGCLNLDQSSEIPATEIDERLRVPLAGMLNSPLSRGPSSSVSAVSLEVAFFFRGPLESTSDTDEANAARAQAIGTSHGSTESETFRDLDDLVSEIAGAADRLHALELVLSLDPVERIRLRKHLGINWTTSQFDAAQRIVDRSHSAVSERNSAIFERKLGELIDLIRSASTEQEALKLAYPQAVALLHSLNLQVEGTPSRKDFELECARVVVKTLRGHQA